MKRISYLFLGVALAVAATSCRNSKTAGASGQSLSFGDYLQLFPPVSPPFSWDRDSLERKIPDSLALDRKKVGPYLADSLWGATAGARSAALLFPVAGMSYAGPLRLLVMEAVTSDARRGWLLVYGKGDTLVTALQVASLDQRNPQDVFTLNIDNQHLVHINERKTLDAGEVILRERVYAVNGDGTTMLILTNTNQPASAGSYVNPIDTLPAREGHSGDYKSGPAGLVSIRDGKTPGEFRFFIHLDQNGGDCTGEVDGVARFTGKSTAEFSQQGDPCAIRFTFSHNQVEIKETGGCGAYRGVGCYFNGVYRRAAARKAAAPHRKS